MAQQNSPFLPLLKYNDKGWNLQLFENQDKDDSLCVHCGHICCDAVELGCNHNDNDIYSYCSVCLNEKISNNNGKCPVDSHDNPTINAARSLRRQILKYNVYCPHSIQYKQKNNKQQNDDNQNDQNNASNVSIQCEWCGSLNDLITSHIAECTTKYNSNYLLITKLKEIQNKNQLLNIINNEQKEQIKKQLIVINDLKTQNNEYLNQLNEQKQQIDELKSKLQSNDINDNNNDNDDDNKEENNNKYWFMCSNAMTMEEFVVEYVGNYGYATVYGMDIAENGLNEWKIKILHLSSGCSMFIGISSIDNKDKNLNHRFCGKGKDYNDDNVAYSMDAMKLSNTCVGIKYGESYSSNDIISIHLDLNNQTVSFKKNDKYFGIAFDNVKQTKYRLAVSTYAWAGDSAKFQLMSYIHK